MTPKETEFLNKTLSQISKSSSPKDVKEILGPPWRNILNKKYTWKTSLGENCQIISVYFEKDKAVESRFSGGFGRFFYAKNLINGEEYLLQNQPTMKISYQLTLEDWLAFQKYFQENSSTFKQLKKSVQIAMPAILLIYLLFIYFISGPDLFLLIIIPGISAIWFIFYPKKFETESLNNAKKIIEEGDNSALFGETELELKDEYLYTKAPGTESKIFWDKCYKYEETEKYIFIFISTMSAAIIPKFKLESKEKAEELSVKIKEKF